MSAFSLTDLAELIKKRAEASADSSYTRSLLDAGAEQICKKFGEESIELIIAVLSKQRQPIINESADVIYHLLVLLQNAGIDLNEITNELERRTAQSGHAEKAARHK
jgi:phosphoribosyl-ATP pyrophosphohydrolase